MYVARSSRRIADDYGDRLERLVDEGFEVHVLAGPDGGFSDLVDRGIHCRSIPVVYGANLPGWVGAFVIIQAHFIEQRPILVHAHDGWLAWMGAVAASRASVPAIFATVGDHGFDRSADQLVGPAGGSGSGLVAGLRRRLGPWFERLAAPAARKGREWMIRHLGGLVDRYVVTNDRDLRELEERGWVPDEKLETVIGGTGIDIDAFDPEREEYGDPEEIRGEFGLDDDWRLVIGHAGPPPAGARGRELLRALDRIAERRREIGFLFTDDAGDSRRLEERRRMGRIEVAGAVDDPRFFAALDVLVRTGTGRSGAKALMKAQAMRVPVVAFDSPANASVVSDGQTGRLTEPSDVEALVETVLGITDRRRHLRDLGRRARARAVKRFDREHVESQILRLYDTVLEEKLQT